MVVVSSATGRRNRHWRVEESEPRRISGIKSKGLVTNAEAVLREDMLPRENFRHGDRIRGVAAGVFIRPGSAWRAAVRHRSEAGNADRLCSHRSAGNRRGSDW